MQKNNRDRENRLWPSKTPGALITGGSLGIGSAIARELAAGGAKIALHSSGRADARAGHAGALRELADELRSYSPLVAELDMDLGEPGSGTRLARTALEALGNVDILVLCASIQIREAFGELAIATLQQHMRINFESSVETLQTLLPGMSASGWGRVIFIGSLNQERPEPDLAAYAATKSAMHNLIKNLAKKHAPDGITLNTVSPGLIATPRNAWRRKDPAEWARIERGNNPMLHAGRPEDVSCLVRLLASEEAGFITGAEIPVDGGARL